METTRGDQSEVHFVDIYICLTFGTVRKTSEPVLTSRTAMTPFNDGMIPIGLGGAPLLLIRITTGGAFVVQGPLIIAEGKYTGTT